MINDTQLDNNKELEPLQWFVMAPIYYQEAKIKKYLDENNIRNFLPTKSIVKKIRGKKQEIEVPLIYSLLFINTTESELKEICRLHPYLYYKYDNTAGAKGKMVIPDKQMEDFLRISSLKEDEVTLFDPSKCKINFKKGERIRVHSMNHTLDGIEGYYVKIDGRRNKRLIISLNGLLAVATLIDINLIEKI